MKITGVCGDLVLSAGVLLWSVNISSQSCNVLVLFPCSMSSFILSFARSTAGTAARGLPV